MKSSSTDPDFVRMSRFKAAIEVLAVFDQLGGDGRIGLDRGVSAAGRRPGGPSAGSDGMKSPRSRMVCSASPISGSDFPRPPRRDLRGSPVKPASGVTSTNRPPACLGHGTRGRQLPDGEPQGLHGVGHHLLMTDGDVDVVLSVVGRGDGEQRGDRPALDDLEVVVDEAPFDVLGTAEVRFDPPAQLREPHDLRIGQRGLLLLPGSPTWRRPRRRAPGRRPRSPGRRPGLRRGRSRPPRRRPCGCP